MYPRSAPSLFLPSSFSTASAPTEIYTLSLHDALPILSMRSVLELIEQHDLVLFALDRANFGQLRCDHGCVRSEEHTSELQSRGHLVCRLLLEKKKNKETCTIHTLSTSNGHAELHMMQT